MVYNLFDNSLVLLSKKKKRVLQPNLNIAVVPELSENRALVRESKELGACECFLVGKISENQGFLWCYYDRSLYVGRFA